MNWIKIKIQKSSKTYSSESNFPAAKRGEYMEMKENCMECGNDEFEHDNVRAEYHCTICGCIVEDQLDDNVTQFMQ